MGPDLRTARRVLRRRVPAAPRLGRTGADPDPGGLTWEEEGQAAVELVLALPILLFALMLVVEVGLVVRDVLALGAAAREGARATAVSGDPAEAEAAVRAAAGPLEADRISVSVTTDGYRGTPATVVLRYVVRPRVPLVAKVVRTALTLEERSTMRLETGPSPPTPSPSPTPTPSPTPSSSPTPSPTPGLLG